jgi:hypothetical protein
VEHVSHPETRFAALWQKIGTALTALVRKSGNSLTHSPLPEIREAARDWTK